MPFTGRSRQTVTPRLLPASRRLSRGLVIPLQDLKVNEGPPFLRYAQSRVNVEAISSLPHYVQTEVTAISV